MVSSEKRSRTLTGWIYVPCLIMILVGTSIFLFPHLFADIVAGCFILSGLLLIQLLRNLRKTVARVRAQLEASGEEKWDTSPTDLVPTRVYTSYIN